MSGSRWAICALTPSRSISCGVKDRSGDTVRSATSLILKQRRYLLSDRYLGGGAVHGLHRVLLCADLQAVIP